MTMPTNTERCTALKQNGKPVDPCTTCARAKTSPYTTWTLPPAFWNGTRYVCEHHIELQPASQTTTN